MILRFLLTFPLLVQSVISANTAKIQSINVNCEEDGMGVDIQFDQAFHGVIFSKNFFSTSGCNYVNNPGKDKVHFTIKAGQCGTVLQSTSKNGKRQRRDVNATLIDMTTHAPSNGSDLRQGRSDMFGFDFGKIDGMLSFGMPGSNGGSMYENSREDMPPPEAMEFMQQQPQQQQTAPGQTAQSHGPEQSAQYAGSQVASMSSLPQPQFQGQLPVNNINVPNPSVNIPVAPQAGQMSAAESDRIQQYLNNQANRAQSPMSAFGNVNGLYPSVYSPNTQTKVMNFNSAPQPPMAPNPMGNYNLPQGLSVQVPPGAENSNGDYNQYNMRNQNNYQQSQYAQIPLSQQYGYNAGTPAGAYETSDPDSAYGDENTNATKAPIEDAYAFPEFSTTSAPDAEQLYMRSDSYDSPGQVHNVQGFPGYSSVPYGSSVPNAQYLGPSAGNGVPNAQYLGPLSRQYDGGQYVQSPPNVPNMPQYPGTPQAMQSPGMPQVPNYPTGQQVPSYPGVPGAMEMPPSPNMPSYSGGGVDMPSMPQIPVPDQSYGNGMPQMPQQPQIPQGDIYGGGMPQMPQQPQMPQMPQPQGPDVYGGGMPSYGGGMPQMPNVPEPPRMDGYDGGQGNYGGSYSGGSVKQPYSGGEYGTTRATTPMLKTKTTGQTESGEENERSSTRTTTRARIRTTTTELAEEETEEETGYISTKPTTRPTTTMAKVRTTTEAETEEGEETEYITTKKTTLRATTRAATTASRLRTTTTEGEAEDNEETGYISTKPTIRPTTTPATTTEAHLRTTTELEEEEYVARKKPASAEAGESGRKSLKNQLPRLRAVLKDVKGGSGFGTSETESESAQGASESGSSSKQEAELHTSGTQVAGGNNTGEDTAKVIGRGGYGSSGNSGSSGGGYAKGGTANRGSSDGYDTRYDQLGQEPAFGYHEPKNQYDSRYENGGADQSAGGREPSFGYKEPSGPSEPKFQYNEPADQYREPGFGYKEPGFGYREPAGQSEPSFGYNEPKFQYNEPAGQFNREPAFGYREPTGRFSQDASAGGQEPAFGYREPGFGYNEPKFGYQEPAGGVNEPKFGYREPSGPSEPKFGYREPQGGMQPESNTFNQDMSGGPGGKYGGGQPNGNGYVGGQSNGNTYAGGQANANGYATGQQQGGGSYSGATANQGGSYNGGASSFGNYASGTANAPADKQTQNNRQTGEAPTSSIGNKVIKPSPNTGSGQAPTASSGNAGEAPTSSVGNKVVNPSPNTSKAQSPTASSGNAGSVASSIPGKASAGTGGSPSSVALGSGITDMSSKSKGWSHKGYNSDKSAKAGAKATEDSNNTDIDEDEDEATTVRTTKKASSTADQANNAAGSKPDNKAEEGSAYASGSNKGRNGGKVASSLPSVSGNQGSRNGQGRKSDQRDDATGQKVNQGAGSSADKTVSQKGQSASAGQRDQQKRKFDEEEQGENELPTKVISGVQKPKTSAVAQKAADNDGAVDTSDGAYIENIIIIQNDPLVQEVWDAARAIRCEWRSNYKKTVFTKERIALTEVQTMRFAGDDIEVWMEIQAGKGPWADPVSNIVPIGHTMTLLIGANDPKHEFDLRIGRCLAHDGGKSQIDLTDDNGCVLRDRIMSKFDKAKDWGAERATIAFAHFSAFKFPETTKVFIECDVEVCKKGCSEMCSTKSASGRSDTSQSRRVSVGSGGTSGVPKSQTSLSSSTISGAKQRQRRSVKTDTDTLSVRNHYEAISPADVSFNIDINVPLQNGTIIYAGVKQNTDQFCMSRGGFGVGLGVLLTAIIVTSLLSVCLCLRYRNQRPLLL